MLNRRLAIAIMILRIINANDRSRANDIADEIGISVGYFEHIIKDLVSSGYAKGFRGPGGGYMMCATYNKIRLFDLAADMNLMAATDRAHYSKFAEGILIKDMMHE
jgi:DNA-binding IscR family transcriptional regulator